MELESFHISIKMRREEKEAIRKAASWFISPPRKPDESPSPTNKYLPPINLRLFRRQTNFHDNLQEVTYSNAACDRIIKQRKEQRQLREQTQRKTLHNTTRRRHNKVFTPAKVRINNLVFAPTHTANMSFCSVTVAQARKEYANFHYANRNTIYRPGQKVTQKEISFYPDGFPSGLCPNAPRLVPDRQSVLREREVNFPSLIGCFCEPHLRIRDGEARHHPMYGATRQGPEAAAAAAVEPEASPRRCRCCQKPLPAAAAAAGVEQEDSSLMGAVGGEFPPPLKLGKSWPSGDHTRHLDGGYLSDIDEDVRNLTIQDAVGGAEMAVDEDLTEVKAHWRESAAVDADEELFPAPEVKRRSPDILDDDWLLHIDLFVDDAVKEKCAEAENQLNMEFQEKLQLDQ